MSRPTATPLTALTGFGFSRFKKNWATVQIPPATTTTPPPSQLSTCWLSETKRQIASIASHLDHRSPIRFIYQRQSLASGVLTPLRDGGCILRGHCYPAHYSSPPLTQGLHRGRHAPLILLESTPRPSGIELHDGF